jgi:hypothetical protein
MPPKIYLHQHKEFRDLVLAIEDQKDIDRYLIEKDYWIMHCLYGLKQVSYNFELKGGTSLSKGYGLIHRFSEDIDIHIAPPEHLHVRIGKNHDEEKDRQSRKEYYDYLAEAIKISGIIKVERDIKFDTPPKYRSGGIRMYYEAKFPSTGDAKEGVLLEAGFDDIAPNHPLDISSWAFDFALEHKLEIIDNRALHIPCYEPGYTLVEKLQTISTKFRQQQAGNDFPQNFMRHYYDVYCLLQDSNVQKFIGTDPYTKHKEKRFRGADKKTPLNRNQAFLLGDKETRELYKKEYEKRPKLYYNGQPPFDDLLTVIQKNLDRL